MDVCVSQSCRHVVHMPGGSWKKSLAWDRAQHSTVFCHFVVVKTPERELLWRIVGVVRSETGYCRVSSKAEAQFMEILNIGVRRLESEMPPTTVKLGRPGFPDTAAHPGE